MAKKSLLCFGEVAWDGMWIVNRLPRSEGDCHLLLDQGGAGGCALNTACVLAGFGLPVDLAGNAVGQDLRGRTLRRYLRQVGVRSMIRSWSGVETPFCQCMVEEKTGYRQFILRHETIQETRPELWNDAVRRAQKGAYSHAFVQPYLEELSFRFLTAIRDVPDLWLMIQDVPAQSPFVPKVDAVQVSLTPEQKFDLKTCRSTSKAYFRGRLRQVFVTAGDRGAAYCERGSDPVLFPALQVPRVLDTTGCGDAFRAGVMAGLYRGLDIQKAVRLGIRWGARKAEVYGSHFSDGVL